MRAWHSLAPATVLFVSCLEAGAGQLAMDECVRLALARSPSLTAASAEARAARERVRAAKAAFLPTVSGHAEYGKSGGYDDAVTNGGSTVTVLRMEFPVLDGGLRRAEVQVANARLQSAAAVEQQRRADVVLAVRTAYLTGLAAAEEARIYDRAIKALGDSIALLKDQESRGVVPRDDVLRAEVARETAREAQRSAAAIALSSTRELGALTGVTIATADLVSAGESLAAEPTDASIDASPTIYDARAQAEAARREVDAALSARRGQLTFGADAGFVGVTPEHAFPDNGGAQFLLGFTVPIYDGGAATARVAAAAAMAESAEANIRAIRQRMEIDLARFGAEGARARAQMESWRQVAPRAEDAFQLMRARYFGGGNVRLLEVLDALKQAVDSRVAAERSRLEYGLALAERDQLLGVIP